MSSTEQKNVSQPFVSNCYVYGILPTVLTGVFDNYHLATDLPPFEELGKTPNLGSRLRDADDPIQLANKLFPNLHRATACTRLAPFLLRLTTDAKTYCGNSAVLRLCSAITRRKWGLHFTESGAVKHAYRHVSQVSNLLAPAAYGVSARTEHNVGRFNATPDRRYYRGAADFFDQLSRSFHHHKNARMVRQWCIKYRSCTSFQGRYRDNKKAIDHYNSFSSSSIHSAPDPPHIAQSWFRTEKSSSYDIKIYHCSDFYYIKVFKKHARVAASSLIEPSTRRLHSRLHQSRRQKVGSDHELYVLSNRDLQDISFLLNACSAIKLYHKRRTFDLRRDWKDGRLQKSQQMMWALYLDAMEHCGNEFSCRNKLGVYFDVLQWRYLAWKSGDTFYDHSSIMRQKLKSKGLLSMPSQEVMLQQLQSIPVDWAVDLLGQYKASVYPEVDPFLVVGEQYKLHMSRFQTDWLLGSEEYERFSDTKSYMWYLGIRVLHKRLGIWPGKIREGTEVKQWHAKYKTEGIGGEYWRDAHDVDLTGAVIVADITNEQYFKQADSACAPSMPSSYTDYEAMRRAPRRHKRKLLYAIQEPELPDLPGVLNKLNDIGRQLPDQYVGEVSTDFEFTTDIVTGSRCERHKDAPRPFYAASPPWGCILSYFDGLTRDFLNYVPQSMLGKSTRQKFMDLQSASDKDDLERYCFYMSDDKAKYSPRMDPMSQQLPADFFSELFDIPGMRAYGPIMYHCELYYRVHGHLVHYNSNGTDREGMRGSSNTWLEIVAQGLSTRVCREKGLLKGKSHFLSFIDDGLRKFTIESNKREDSECWEAARNVINDVIFGLKVLGRELSWDKTFISREMFVMLNELVVDGSFISSGLKSFCTIGDLELKEVMTASDYEQLYFGKMRGAHGVGAPIDLCHYIYVFELLAAHYRMGVRLQDKHGLYPIDYRLFCITPLSFGGAGVRSLSQMGCNEVANVTKEGIGMMIRLGYEYPLLGHCMTAVMEQPVEELSPLDFMREPEQFHVTGPRIKTQRLVSAMRRKLRSLASNSLSRQYLEQDQLGEEFLTTMGEVFQAMPATSAEEIRLIYASSPVMFIDEFIQKLASSATLAEFLDKSELQRLRRLVRKDLLEALEYFPKRCFSRETLRFASNNPELIASIGSLNS